MPEQPSSGAPAPSEEHPAGLTATVEHRSAQAGYEAALGATDRAALPSLRDFLR